MHKTSIQKTGETTVSAISDGRMMCWCQPGSIAAAGAS